MSNYSLSHLDHLESEAIYILRETAAQFENPVLLFSGGKDSIIMAHLAYKAFYPSKIPFVLIDYLSFIIAVFCHLSKEKRDKDLVF